MAYPCLLLGTIGSANYVREEATPDVPYICRNRRRQGRLTGTASWSSRNRIPAEFMLQVADMIDRL